jgi:hypothetical protein
LAKTKFKTFTAEGAKDAEVFNLPSYQITHLPNFLIRAIRVVRG